jgi:surface antigen
MVAGKLSILLAASSAFADSVENPRFFEYRGGPAFSQHLNMMFGYFRTLSDEQKSHYVQSINHALMYAENGESVSWYHSDASGKTVPVMTWPAGDGYCRRLHLEVIAYNQKKSMATTACYSNSTSSWRWISDKY